MRSATLLPALLMAVSSWCGEEAKATPAREPLTPRNDLPGLTNYAKVSDALHRGAQPTAEGFAELKKMGIKTVVNLRSFNSDRDELEGLGLQYVHIYCKAWHPEDEDVVKFLQVLKDPKNHPVFVHCQHGSDRTGMMVASYRIVEQGWSVEDAAKELERFGFHKLWTEIAKYLKSFDKDTMLKQVEAAKPVKVEVVK
ncbi:MAG: dual specificity protein phosphatase family protein [Planctomycetota bacterium]|nr:dual specificity protein phosphatase family protein [Planctomycetota bacterium]